MVCQEKLVDENIDITEELLKTAFNLTQSINSHSNLITYDKIRYESFYSNKSLAPF